MKKKSRSIYFWLTIFGLLSGNQVFAQDRFDSVRTKLTELSNIYPGLEQNVELNVADVNLSEFLNSIAISNRINISVDETLNFSITNNFSNLNVIDVLDFLGRKYDLDIKFIGSIISISKHKAQSEINQANQYKQLSIHYVTDSDLLSMDLKKDTLFAVAKEISKVSGKNIVVSQDLNNTLVSTFVQNQPFSTGLDMLAYANNLKVSSPQVGVYIFERAESERNSGQGGRSGSSLASKRNKIVNGLDLKIKDGLITLSSINVPIQDIITAVADKFNYNYFILSDIKGTATLNLENSDYENLLTFLLNGTEYTYRKENDIYLFGDRNLEGLRATKVIPLKYRTVDKVLDFIPAELKKGVEVKTFPELNSIIASGSQPKINELVNFINDIDKVVPMVSIEVIILDVSNSSEVTKGITAGISQTPVQTQGTIFPGVNLTLSSSSINNVIDNIGGLSSLNLGHVSPNFYVTLQLLETNGAIKIRSTPKIATLNGHSATLTIGQTQYYLETQNTVIGTQNPQNITTQQYKSVNADLSLIINPLVSSDEDITLDIKVKQTAFTTRISPTAPPGSNTQNFDALIRIKNDETIILGGLESDNITDTGSGIPGLSRIPVLKWIFGNKDLSKSKDKLVVLVKPTIIY